MLRGRLEEQRRSTGARSTRSDGRKNYRRGESAGPVTQPGRYGSRATLRSGRHRCQRKVADTTREIESAAPTDQADRPVDDSPPRRSAPLDLTWVIRNGANLFTPFSASPITSPSSKLSSRYFRHINKYHGYTVVSDDSGVAVFGKLSHHLQRTISSCLYRNVA
uniref:Uncharacterized protein n=1 Tax=Plectus sambesii TaxID=2011161 RepID=A0A914XQD3_9BILA